MLGIIKQPLPLPTESKFFNESSTETPVSWFDYGAITLVKDEGVFGSCWIFSVTEALKGAHHLSTGSLVSFSEQQLVSCNHANNGCFGGAQFDAFNYWVFYKAETEEAYPYVSGTGHTPYCRYIERMATDVNVSDYGWVIKNNDSQMKAALAEKGPLAVSIEADQLVFQSYESGFLDSKACGTQLDHGVIAVGWAVDQDSGLEYWLVKNSWGTSFGEQGYIKIAIEDGEGICGIN